VSKPDRKQSLSRAEVPRLENRSPSTFLPDYSVAIVEAVRQPLVLLDAGLRVLVANAAFYRSFGVTAAETRRRSLFDIAHSRWDSPELHAVLARLQHRDIAFENHEVRVLIDGSARVYRLNARRLGASDQDSETILLAFDDVTEQLRVDERLRELARMEAIGQLAGGVAHEINNQMTVLSGFLAFVTRGFSPDNPLRNDLRHAERAAEHVVYVTRQLLNFSRKQMIKREIIDPWTMLQGMRTLLGRVIGEHILVDLIRKGEVRAVQFDPSQLAEVFINLALNSRYAMGRTGTFEIALSPVQVDARTSDPDNGFSSQPPGRYVRFEVRDTGTGMDEATSRRIFEPFFTTKPIGEGTGLGLASVLGAVTQNGGFIRVESEPGAGTTFIIELPEVPRGAEGPGERVTSEELSSGSETIIVADEDEGVRTFIGRALGDLGYTVLQARDGEDVLRLFSEHPSEVRLVLTELVMPRGDGREVGERMAARAPDVPVLYMSAYTESEVTRRRLLTTVDAFLPKPFSPSLLAERVRAALDGTNHHPSGQVDVPSR